MPIFFKFLVLEALAFVIHKKLSSKAFCVLIMVFMPYLLNSIDLAIWKVLRVGRFCVSAGYHVKN